MMRKQWRLQNNGNPIVQSNIYVLLLSRHLHGCDSDDIRYCLSHTERDGESTCGGQQDHLLYEGKYTINFVSNNTHRCHLIGQSISGLVENFRWWGQFLHDFDCHTDAHRGLHPDFYPNRQFPGFDWRDLWSTQSKASKSLSNSSITNASHWKVRTPGLNREIKYF